MRVAMLEEGELARHGRVHRAPARHDRAALPRRRPDRHARARRRSCCRSAGPSAARRWSTPAPASARPPPCSSCGASDFGLEELTRAALEPFFRRVERELNVAQVPAELAGRNAAVVRRGAEALGWSGDFLCRNVRGCVGSGVCAFGCPAGAKQHVGITYVPARLGRGRHHVHGRPRASGSSSTRRPRPRGRAPRTARRRARCGSRCEHVDRRLRRDPHAAAAAPRRASGGESGELGPQPRDPPGDRGCARCSTRTIEHVARRAAVLLRATSSPTRASCSRAPPARRTTWRWPLPGARRAPPRADGAATGTIVAVRGDGLRHLARARARGARARRTIRYDLNARRRRRLQARDRAAGRALLGGGRARPSRPGGRRAGRCATATPARCSGRACAPATSS